MVWLCLAVLFELAEKYSLQSLESGVQTLMFSAPGGPISMVDTPISSRGHGLLALALSVITHAAIGAWFLRRFGRTPNRPLHTLGSQPVGADVALGAGWLAPPRRNQFTALVWKQFHETGPLALLAFVAVLLFTGLVVWVESDSRTATTVVEWLVTITIGTGLLVTAVAGMGVFLEDVKPGVSQFWRSRPVNTTSWFFIKYFSGLALLVLTFGSLVLLSLALPQAKNFFSSEHVASSAGFIAMAFLLIYTISMASYCLTRQPVMAVMMTIGVLIGGGYVLGFLAREYGGDQEWFVMMSLVLAQFGALSIVWLTVRNNWGWQKS